MKILLKRITVLLLFSSFFATAQSITVSTIDEYNSAIKKVSTGGTIIGKMVRSMHVAMEPNNTQLL
jgi:hypothetical protein